MSSATLVASLPAPSGIASVALAPVLPTIASTPPSVALAAAGLDHPRPELASQAGQERLQGVRLAFRADPVEVVQQLARWHDLPLPVQQEGQEPVFEGGQFGGAAVDADRAGAGVELHRPGPEHRRGVAGGAPEDRPQARDQLLHAERLGQVIVRAGVDALDALAPAVPGGEDQHRQGHLGGAQPAQHPEPVEARQPEIEHHGVVGLGLGAEPRRLAVAHHVGDVAGPLQPLPDVGGDARLVLDDQDAHRRPRRSIIVVRVQDLQGAGIDLHGPALPVGAEDAQLVQPMPVITLQIDRHHVARHGRAGGAQHLVEGADLALLQGAAGAVGILGGAGRQAGAGEAREQADQGGAVRVQGFHAGTR